MKLAEYIEKNCVNRRKFCEKIGCHYANLRLFTRKEPSAPHIRTALAIELATRGEVKVIDLLPEKDIENLKELGLL